MKWELMEPRPGDMIRVKAGPLYHYGIYVSDSEILQFGTNPAGRSGCRDADIRVCATDMDSFLLGQFLEVGVPTGKTRRKAADPDTVIARARSRLGQSGYHILYNNCEHFAYECVTGEKYCAQTEDVRGFFRNMSVVDLYLAAIPDTPADTVYPPQRQAQIDATANEKLRQERYYVWKLLEYALQRSFGKKMTDLHFSKDDGGKWSCKEYFFSLSHSHGAVAVAVSRKNVGVDIESLQRPMSPGLPDKILTATERAEYDTLPQEAQLPFLLGKWCAKESLFKAGSETAFLPNRLETDRNLRCGTVTIAGAPFCYAVATETPEKLRIYQNIPL